MPPGVKFKEDGTDGTRHIVFPKHEGRASEFLRWLRSKPTVRSIDERLHAERVGPDRSKRSCRENLDDLPDGVFITLEGRDQDALLILCDELFAWFPYGYRERRPRPRGERGSVLTPESTVKVIGAGYVPQVHPSAWNP
jgi:hypothetical protein